MAEQDFAGQDVDILQNKSIKDTGVNRIPDVVVRDKLTGQVLEVYEAARTNADGSFVSREIDKMQDYIDAGIPYHFEPVQP
jgi:hypothetical protein